MIKKTLLGLLALLVLGIGYIYTRTQPSGDINKYEEYFVGDSAPGDSSVMVTFFGVSTLLIDDGETQLLIDGFFSHKTLMTCLFEEVESDTALISKFIDDYNIDRLQGIFVTHSHFDHGFDAGHVAKLTGAPLYGSSSTLNIGRGADVVEDQLRLYEPNVDMQIGNFTVRVVPSLHSPGGTFPGEIIEPLRQPVKWDAYTEGGSFDFLITYGGKKMYIKPSPNYINGALDSLDVDLLFLGIATVTKQGDEFADNFYNENVKVLEPSILIPIHWDNFFEPISANLAMLPKFTCDAEDDFDYFIRRTKADGIEFKILQGTKSMIVFK